MKTVTLIITNVESVDDEETLKTHLKSKHQGGSIIKKHKCDFCLYSNDRLSNFKYHLFAHNKEKPF